MYLSFARSGIGAVFLVDDDGIVDVVHDDIFEFDVGGGNADGRRLPWLDSYTVGGVGEGAIYNVYPRHIMLVAVLPQAANADAMAGAAGDFGDVDVLSPRPERDAVVSGAYLRFRDLYVLRFTDVNPIRVGAITWCSDFNASDVHAVALEDDYVEELAIQGSYAFNRPIFYEAKS